VLPSKTKAGFKRAATVTETRLANLRQEFLYCGAADLSLYRALSGFPGGRSGLTLITACERCLASFFSARRTSFPVLSEALRSEMASAGFRLGCGFGRVDSLVFCAAFTAGLYLSRRGRVTRAAQEQCQLAQ
jgi:hypothetical protein